MLFVRDRLANDRSCLQSCCPSICRLPEMLKVIAQDFIKPEHVADVLPLYRELVQETLLEPGCIAYELFIDQKDPGHFIFIEQWPDRAALDAHCATAHFQRLVPMIDKFQRQPGTYLLMDAFS